MTSWLKHKTRRLRERAANLRRFVVLERDWLAYGRHYGARRQAGGSAGAVADAGIVVSLTSYPPRFATLHLTLKSLLSQSLAPARVVLWIARADMDKLPPAVTALRAAGLEIEACDDTRSYKKMIPLLQQGERRAIVTADDDVYYWRDWLQQLADARTPGRLEVVCHRMHRIRLDAAGLPLPYSDWEHDVHDTRADVTHFPTGIGGVLYPPGVFGPEVLDVAAFSRLCPNGDDIWFYWMARSNGARSKRVPDVNQLYCWEGSQEAALWQNNLVGKANDTQIGAMIGAYGFFGVPASAAGKATAL
ncbi:glycosyltransferase family 2 protein [Duganella sp. Leaf126]|uniref:glycosyltransferase family 2 protein n=1 Tax=Duganella sp. Leaf126 TaxID=1736266 RepID=UPI000A8EC110|nr:glycosyltransferase family 2 protein [Duganella sp. Leaf126]